MRSTALSPALAPLQQIAAAGGLREARNPLHPHPQQRWWLRYQETLCQLPYQNWSVRTPLPGKPAESTSPHQRPWTLRWRSLPLRVWRTHPKTHHMPKNSPVIIASDSDSEATEEWQGGRVTVYPGADKFIAMGNRVGYLLFLRPTLHTHRFAEGLLLLQHYCYGLSVRWDIARPERGSCYFSISLGTICEMGHVLHHASIHIAVVHIQVYTHSLLIPGDLESDLETQVPRKKTTTHFILTVLVSDRHPACRKVVFRSIN